MYTHKQNTNKWNRNVASTSRLERRNSGSVGLEQVARAERRLVASTLWRDTDFFPAATESFNQALSTKGKMGENKKKPKKTRNKPETWATESGREKKREKKRKQEERQKKPVYRRQRKWCSFRCLVSCHLRRNRNEVRLYRLMNSSSSIRFQILSVWFILGERFEFKDELSVSWYSCLAIWMIPWSLKMRWKLVENENEMLESKSGCECCSLMQKWSVRRRGSFVGWKLFPQHHTPSQVDWDNSFDFRFIRLLGHLRGQLAQAVPGAEVLGRTFPDAFPLHAGSDRSEWTGHSFSF